MDLVCDALLVAMTKLHLCGLFQKREDSRPGAAPETVGKLITDCWRHSLGLSDGEQIILSHSTGYNLYLFTRNFRNHRTHTRFGKIQLRRESPAVFLKPPHPLGIGESPEIGVGLLGDDQVFAIAEFEGSIPVRLHHALQLDRFKYHKRFSCCALLGDERFLVGTKEGDVLDMRCNSADGTLEHSRTVIAGPYDIDNIAVCGNRFAISCLSSNVVAVFELDNLERIGIATIQQPSSIQLTDQLLVIGSDSGLIFLYDAITLNFVKEMKIHSKRVTSVNVIADARYLLSGAWDGFVSISDVNSGTGLWQKQFKGGVLSTFQISDGRLVTSFVNEQAVVHSIPDNCAALITPPPTPLRDAFENCISGVDVPAEKCKEFITFQRCCASFDEWCCAHQLLMMAVEDGDIPRSRDYNGQISWWFENLYLAAKEVQRASDDDIRTLKRFLLQAKAMGMVEGVEPVLAAMRLTQDLRAEVRALQRADILMLERVLSIEERIGKLKEAFDRYRKYTRNSQLLGVALQIIPIVGGSVAGAVSVGAEVLEGLSAKDLTDYFLGLGSNLLSDAVSSMGERVFNVAADALSAEKWEKMQAEHR